MANAIVLAERLSKIYGEVRALDECSFEVPAGMVFGLLGPNGAGKTTLIRTLLGFLTPTSGLATVDGWNCATQSVEVRRRVAYLPAEAKLFRTMRGRDVLDFFSSIHPAGDRALATKMASRLELDLSRRVAFMSTGMRQKLALASIASCRTPLLILDEPTANLDPTVRGEVLAMVKEVHRDGRSVVMCSHVLQEVEEVCQKAAILRKGKVVHEVDILHMKSIHRITGMLAKDDQPLSSIALPTGVEWAKSELPSIAIDVAGPLEAHWRWLESLSLVAMRIEPVGLRSIYERFHGSPGPYEKV